MSDTPITPTVGAVTIAGVAPVTGNINGFYGRGGDGSGNGQIIAYTGLVNGKAGVSYPDLGQPNPGGLGGFKSVEMQATGTFGAGGSVQLEGSLDGTNWAKLSPAALTSAGFTTSLGASERVRYVRPNVTAGDGTTLITALLWITYGP